MTTTNKDTLIAEIIKMAQDIKALNILDVTAEDISTYDDVSDYQSSIDDLHDHHQPPLGRAQSPMLQGRACDGLR